MQRLRWHLSVSSQQTGGEAVAEQGRVANHIRRAVAEGLALCKTRLRDVDIARRRVATSQEGYQLDLIRTRNLKGRPIEVLNSLNLLFAGRLELIRAVVGYNQAQFQLLVALGQPPVGSGMTPPVTGKACR